MKAKGIVGWVCQLAFLMDAGTGVLLVAAPAFCIGLMGLDAEVEPEAYMRFIGAFVFSIGCLYGLAWRYLKADRVLEWRALWLATGWARLCVGTTVLGLILAGQLSVAWASVPVADLGLGVFQLVHWVRTKEADA